MRFLAVFLLATASYAEMRFVTGQGARLIIGQPTFTAQEPGVSERLLGAVSGLAYANDMLIVADSNRVSALPLNHRVLLFKNLSHQLPAPEDELPFTGQRCLVCVGSADVVLGQTAADKGDQPLTPGADKLRLPVGVATDGVRLAVADTDHNRVLIWNSIPFYTGQPADVVVGQPNFQTSTSTGFNPNDKSLKGPQGVWIRDGKLFVADTGNNRVLIWNTIPTTDHAAANVVLGAPDFNTFVQPDLTKADLEPKANTLLTPVAVTSDGQRLYVTDLGHNRVLIWSTIPTANQAPADIVIGQPNFETAIANNSAGLCESIGEDDEGNKFYPRRCAATLEFPRFALSDGNRLFIADGGNDRILVFNQVPAANGKAADVVIGQVNEFANNVSDSAFPDDVASAGVVRTPMSLAWDGRNLYASDPFNRRVLVFTLAEQRVATTGVRNAASLNVFAVGVVTIDGTPAVDQEVTIVIQEEREYTYKVLQGDELEDIVNGLAALINEDEGDPEVFATPNPEFNAVVLTAKIGGGLGNNIKMAVKTSEGATLVVQTDGATLRGGGEATKIAPGTIVSIIGEDLADREEAAPPDAKVLPGELAGVQVYFDGYRAPLFYVSPKQINAQMPLNVFDSQGVSAYVRTRHDDGRVVASNAVAVPIIQFNPGIFAEGDTEPRPAVSLHSSSNAMGVVSVDGQAKAGDTATVIIGDAESDAARRYSYTVVAEDVPAEGEPARLGLEKIRDALVARINEDPEVQAFPAGIFATRIRLEARVPGPAGNGIKYSAASAATSGEASVILTATTSELCCANEGGAHVTVENPAIAGEIITIYATGLGIVQPEEARQRQFTGEAYDGPELNEPVEFVSALCGGRTANVLASGLMPGMIGIFRVDLQLNSGLPTNPKTQCTIAQGFQVSNIATVPVFNPNPEEQ